MCKYVQHTSNIYDTSTQTSNIAATTLVSLVGTKQGIQHCQCYLCITMVFQQKNHSVLWRAQFFRIKFSLCFGCLLPVCIASLERVSPASVSSSSEASDQNIGGPSDRRSRRSTYLTKGRRSRQAKYTAFTH